MDSLRVPKHSAQVEVMLPAGGTREVSVFLAESYASHGGAETIEDLINHPETFIPATDSASGQATCLNLAEISAMWVSRELGEEHDAGEPTRHEVEVFLRDGRSLSGVIAYVMPAESSRLVDLLNHSARFIRVESEKRVAYVNRSHIVRIVNLD